MFASYGVGFNLIFGSTNQLFLCVGALAGVGGYGAVILMDETSLPMAAGVVVGTASAAIVGGLLSWIAVRRSLGDHLHRHRHARVLARVRQPPPRPA